MAREEVSMCRPLGEGEFGRGGGGGVTGPGRHMPGWSCGRSRPRTEQSPDHWFRGGAMPKGSQTPEGKGRENWCLNKEPTLDRHLYLPCKACRTDPHPTQDAWEGWEADSPQPMHPPLLQPTFLLIQLVNLSVFNYPGPACRTQLPPPCETLPKALLYLSFHCPQG